MKTATKTFEDIGFKSKINNELEKNFDENLKDESFKVLVEKLCVPKEKLIKYNSSLEESSKVYKHCLECKNILDCPYQMTGYAYLPKIVDGNLTFGYQACKYRKKLDMKNNYLKNIYLFEIPNEIKEANINKIYMNDPNRIEVIEWIHKFMNNYPENKHQKGLYLYGNFGCGKTYLISAMFNELAKNNVKSAIVYWPEFLRSLKASFQTDFNEKFEMIKKVELLLIDDIGAESTSSWSRDEILGPILQYRMQEQLPTFFTSNLDKTALEEHLGNSKDGIEVVKARRIIERVNQLTDEITLISKNLRK
ncbi:MAG: primosomal protein DnaI [Firmicutes bacterium]|nr:primosomal protein DnaI [Bacillota bacterium]